MNDRIRKLRDSTLAAVPRIGIERAKIVTETAETPEYQRASVPVRRALVFKAIFENKELYVGEGELFVGERGPAPPPCRPIRKSASTPPRISTCSIPARRFPTASMKKRAAFTSRKCARSGRAALSANGCSANCPGNGATPTRPACSPSSRSSAPPGHTVLGEKIYEKGILDLKLLSGYFNIPGVLEITLHNGTDPRTGKKTGVGTGDPRTFETFDEFFGAFSRQLRHFVDIKIRGNNLIESLYAKYMPAPFLSLLIDDCIATGRDYHQGGARYNSTCIQGVGLGTVADSFASIKFNVFDARACSWDELLAALDSNFEDRDDLRRRFLDETPKYGNDDEGLDHFVDLVRTYFSKDTHHIQFNVVARETLEDARRHPEKHRDLIVRVAGYSDYFVNLTPELQDEIIRRTEHEKQ